VNYDEEAIYIEDVDPKNPGPVFNHDSECFMTYCKMQYNGACKAESWAAAVRIVDVINHYYKNCPL